MITPLARLRCISRFFLFFIIVFALLVTAIAIYMNYDREREEALEVASRLPGHFVANCQEVSENTGFPWCYLAAYYQISAERSGEEKSYPTKETIRTLARNIAACDGRSVKSKLRKLQGRETANLVSDRAKVLRKGGSLFSGEYFFPVERNKIWYSDTWLAPRDGGDRQHLGTDVFAPEGTPVFACTDGTISRIGWNELGGNRIGLVGKDGIYYYYAHLQSYAPGLEEGQRVSRGQLLGSVGHTGNAVGTPDHLHFGILLDWETWVNPYNFLVFWESRGQ